MGPDRGIGGMRSRGLGGGFRIPRSTGGRQGRPRIRLGTGRGGRGVFEAVVPPDPIFSQTGTNMSIWADLGRGLLGAVGRRVEREIIGPVGTVKQPGQPAQVPISFPTVAGTTQAGFLPAIVAGGRAVLRSPAAQGVIGGALGALAFSGGGANGCPSGFHPAKDGSGRCVRNRRMNVANPRAGRRAIRRIKGLRKMLQSIEKQLPRKATARRSSTVGHGHKVTNV